MHIFHILVALLSSLSVVTANALPSDLIAARLAARRIEQYVNLRIEGETTAIYEAPIISGPRNITTASGGTYPCDGTNSGENPTPGNTPTDALDAASKLTNFTYDGTFDVTFDDFFITRIGPDAETATMFWGLLVNYQFTPVGGCQFETKPGDHVLWAFDAFNKDHFLKLDPPAAFVKKGKSLMVTVTDGLTGVPVTGAVVDGAKTDAAGYATLAFPEVGVFEYKATMPGSLQSNVLYVVTA